MHPLQKELTDAVVVVAAAFESSPRLTMLNPNRIAVMV